MRSPVLKGWGEALLSFTNPFASFRLEKTGRNCSTLFYCQAFNTTNYFISVSLSSNLFLLSNTAFVCSCNTIFLAGPACLGFVVGKAYIPSVLLSSSSQYYYYQRDKLMNFDNISHVGQHWIGERLRFVFLAMTNLFQIVAKLSCNRTTIVVFIRLQTPLPTKHVPGGRFNYEYV